MRTFFLIVFTCLSLSMQAQKVQAVMDSLYKNYPQEKLVLTFSKKAYLAGETAHFTVYALTGYHPSTISTTVYAELYNRDKHLLAKTMVPLLQSSGEGSFLLPDSLKEDVYYVRAYTQWMLNFDKAFQYLRPLRVYNPSSALQLQARPVKWRASAVIEGGQLLAGAPAHVAIRLNALGRLPNAWRGELIEQSSGQAVAAVSVYNHEIGAVRFPPQAGKQYVLQLADDQGNRQDLLLPPVAATGLAFGVFVLPNKLQYTFTNSAQPGKPGYTLVGTLQDELLFRVPLKNMAAGISGTIDISKLPAGVLRLTVFDDNETPLLERLCFLHHERLPVQTPALFTDSVSFVAKSVNRWRLAVDTATWPTYVVQVAAGGTDVDDSFLGQLYLTSDFPGEVQDPQVYFENVTAEKEAALDALLLTESWRRFQWDAVLRRQFPVLLHPAETYLSYTGTVYAGGRRQAQRELSLLLRGADSSAQFLTVQTDKAGNFQLSGLLFADSLQVFLQPSKQITLAAGDRVDFQLQNRFDSLPPAALPPVPWELGARTANPSALAGNAPAYQPQASASANRNRPLQEVRIRTTVRSKTKVLEEALGTPLFTATEGRVIDFINTDQSSVYVYFNVLDWMRGRVPGFRMKRTDTRIDDSADKGPTLRGESVQFFLDEMPLPDPILVLSTIPTHDLALIKVFPNSFVGAMLNRPAIAIYTKRGMLRSDDKPPVSHGLLVGYPTSPPVLAPDYTDPANRQLADNRTVLYRATTGEVDEDGTAVFSFYNNDTARSFTVVVTGFTKDGRPVFLRTQIR